MKPSALQKFKKLERSLTSRYYPFTVAALFLLVPAAPEARPTRCPPATTPSRVCTRPTCLATACPSPLFRSPAFGYLQKLYPTAFLLRRQPRGDRSCRASHRKSKRRRQSGKKPSFGPTALAASPVSTD